MVPSRKLKRRSVSGHTPDVIMIRSGDSMIFPGYDSIIDGTCSVLAVTNLEIALQGDSLVGEQE